MKSFLQHGAFSLREQLKSVMLCTNFVKKGWSEFL